MSVHRGSELPWAKLSEDDVKLIRAAAVERERLRAEARQLSNVALAEKFEVHERTIEKVLQFETWIHVEVAA